MTAGERIEDINEYVRRPVREVGRTGGKGAVFGSDEHVVVVGVNHGRVTIRGEADLDSGGLYHHLKLVVRAAEAAARWRGEQAALAPGAGSPEGGEVGAEAIAAGEA